MIIARYFSRQMPLLPPNQEYQSTDSVCDQYCTVRGVQSDLHGVRVLAQSRSLPFEGDSKSRYVQWKLR